jgi:sugar/nucleoside kinase (ribokinase family)
MSYDFITIGGATRDIAFFTNEGLLVDNKKDPLRQKLLAFEYGAKIRIDKFINLFGGGAANAAVNLSGLGFKTASLFEVGDDENGREIIKNIKRFKVDTSLIGVNKKHDSGSSFILITDSGERVIFTTRGANDFLDLNSKRIKKIRQAKNIYIASLSGSWLKDLRIIFKEAAGNIFWNPGAKQYGSGLKVLAPFLKKTYCLMLNRDEALELVLSDPATKEPSKIFNTDTLLKIIKSYGPQIVAITDGNKGADFYDGKAFYHQDVAKEKKHLDTTGIGDVYNSTFAAGLLAFKGDILKAARVASKNAAHKISYLGAQNGLLTKKDLIK